MGPSEYGVYSYAFAVLMLAAIPAQVGVPQLIVRETAKAQVVKDWALMHGLWRWGNLAVIRFSFLGLFLSILVVIVALAFGNSSGRLPVVVTGIALIPLMALNAVRGACLRGLRKVIIGQLPDSIIRPALFILILGVFSLLSGSGKFYTAERAMLMHVAATILAFAFASFMLWREKPNELTQKLEPRYEKVAWRKAVIPLAMITGLHLINNYADLVILGFFRPDDEVGVYRAIFQIALLVVFGLQAINQVLHPHFARIYQEQDMQKLQRLVTVSSRGILALALPPALIFIFFGSSLIEWIFGAQFKIGAMALSILVVGQLGSAAFGSVGALLNMTGNERDTVRGLGIAIVANIFLNFTLIPFWGMEGAAVATSSSLLIWNFILRKSVWKRLSIETSALGIWKRKNS